MAELIAKSTNGATFVKGGGGGGWVKVKTKKSVVSQQIFIQKTLSNMTTLLDENKRSDGCE